MKFGIFRIAALAAIAALPVLGSAQAVDGTELMINEIQYDPVGGDNNTTQEWIELFNNTANPIDLSGYRVTAGSFPEFIFPAGATIAPKGFVLLVGKKDEFLGQYQHGVDPDTVYDLNPDARSSRIANSSATISVYAPGEETPLDTVTYQAQAGSNNLGPTIELTDPTADNNDTANWAVSNFNYGSPGKMNSHAVDATISNVTRSIEYPAPTDAVTINANVTGTDPLTGVQLMVDSGLGFAGVPMVDGGGGAYSATIPVQAEGTVVKYYVEATDGAGNVVTFPELAPLRPAAYHVSSDHVTVDDLVINEIMYNPAGADNGANSEYLELRNLRNEPIDLSYYVWDRGEFDYIYNRVIPEGTIIPANGYIVLAGRGEALKAKFPTIDPDLVVDGAWPDGGSVIINGGGTVSLAHANSFDLANYSASTALDDVPFDDASPWPTGADGKSIELIDASQSNDNGANWGLTANPTGTPGLPNSTLNTANLATAGAFLQNQYPELNEDVILEATITGGVDPVTAEIFLSSGSGFVSYPMTNTGGDTYSVNLGQFSSYTAFEYYMVVEEDSDFYMITPQDRFQRFIVENDPVGADDLVINEIMYNNTGADNGEFSEWIEIYNRRATPINMGYYQLGAEVDGTWTSLLPANTIIPGEGFLIYAGKKDAFLAQYPSVDPSLVVDGGWTDGSKMINGGQTPGIVHPNAILWMNQPSVAFDTVPYTPGSNGWPVDGDGISFQLISPELDNSLGENWEASAFQGAETPAMPNDSSSVSDWSVY